jgi:2-polyprenyl-3-methyl-5-hydroxy-6-metoxy-1,4-benzoquinol methylase
MDKSYWNRMGKIYRDEIFSVAESDESKIIKRALRKYAGTGGVAADFGCGIGGFVPMLARHFKRVYAIDFSRSCLQKAESEHGDLGHVSFHCADLTKPKLSFPKVDFILCVNAVITSSLSKRVGIFKNLSAHVKKGGYLFLVVPSLESAYLTNYRLIQWNLDDGMLPSSAIVSGFEKPKSPTACLHQGIVEIDKVPTKHYLKEELTATLEDLNFDVVSFQKVEYGWNTEFDSPPAWMKAPYPWDWLAVARKR